jgi:hypothetical protein
MQPWTRRTRFTHWILLSAGLLSCNSDSCFAQEQSGLQLGSKPNALRLKTPSEPSPSNPGAKPSEPLVSPMDSSQAIKDEAGSFVIGSAGAPLEIGSDLEPSSAVDEFENESIDIALAMRIATASMSHISPFFWWMAGPTSHFVDADVEVSPGPTLAPDRSMTQSLPDLELASPEESDQESIKYVPLMAMNDGSNPVEPPRMDDVQPLRSIAQVEIPSDLPDAMEANSSAELEGDTSSKEPEAESAVRKPIPRKIRMPFEPSDSDITPSISKSVAVPKSSLAEKLPANPFGRDPDSQREQEEPLLDSANRTNDRELQGVDAVNASKPGAHRREIRIDEVASRKEVPAIIQRQSLEPSTAKRIQRAELCLNHYLKNPESTAVRSPWAVMHALLAFGGEYEMVHGNGRVNAIGWMCHNGTCRTQRMFTPKGRGFVPNVGGGVQGHEGQFLAILAQSNVPLDYPIQIGTAKYKVEDLVRYEMATCKERSELTFKLIGLSYYLDSNKQWKANDGKIWSIPKLIQEELAQPIIGSACGGTHRLMGFSFSIRQRQLQDQPINGQYARAAKFVREYVAYTLQLQNPDGSFSTNWYEGRGNEPNDERKVQTSGHMLEWLMFTMTDEEVKSPRIAKGIDFLLSKIYDKRDYKWPIGPRGHATRAVALYRDRTNEGLNSSKDNEPALSASKATPAPIIRK